MSGRRLARFADLWDSAMGGALKYREPVRCSEWAAEHFFLSEMSSAAPGDFVPFETQRVFLDVAGGGVVEKVDVVKSSRVGFTKCLLALIGYLVEHRRRNVLNYHPSDPKAVEFVKLQLNPMLMDCPVMTELATSDALEYQLVKGRAKKFRKTEENTLTQKIFTNGVVLSIRGGSNPNNYRAITADAVLYDEIDGFSQSIRHEGDPLSLGDTRVMESLFRFSLRGSTPTSRETSVLWKSEQLADLRFRFRCRCPLCGELAALDWTHGTELAHGLKFDEGDPDSARHVCPGCGGAWDWTRLGGAMAAGRWEADGGEHIDPADTYRLLGADGAAVPWPRHIAFTGWWTALNPMVPWSDIVRRHMESVSDVQRRKTFVNTVLGDYWVDSVTDVTAEELAGRGEGYHSENADGVPTAPEAAYFFSVAVDVQADRLEAEKRVWGRGRESWGMGYRVFPGDPQGEAVWEDLHSWASEPVDMDGAVGGPNMMIVDSGYQSERVYAYCRRAPDRMVPIKARTSTRGHRIDYDRKIHRERGTRLCMVDPDLMKDMAHVFLRRREPGPGFVHFPAGRGYGDVYYDQLTSQSKRWVRSSTGRERLLWRPKSDLVRDEALDIFLYGIVATMVAEEIGSFDFSWDESTPDG